MQWKQVSFSGFKRWASPLSPQQELPLGNRLDNLSFDLRVTGTPPGFTNTKQVAAWNEASGVFEFDQLDLRWGPLGLSAKGTIGLNPEASTRRRFLWKS